MIVRLCVFSCLREVCTEIATVVVVVLFILFFCMFIFLLCALSSTHFNTQFRYILELCVEKRQNKMAAQSSNILKCTNLSIHNRRQASSVCFTSFPQSFGYEISQKSECSERERQREKNTAADQCIAKCRVYMNIEHTHTFSCHHSIEQYYYVIFGGAHDMPNDMAYRKNVSFP